MSDLAFTLAGDLGGSTPEIVVSFVDSSGRVDHLAKAISRLPEQFKRSTQMIALIQALLAPAQELEDAFLGVMDVKYSIDNADDATLDLIGKLVGQARNGGSNDDYRKFIRVRRIVNGSRGWRRDFIKIITLLFPTAVVEIRPQSGTAVVTVHGPLITDTDTTLLMSFLQLAHGAGVRVVLTTFPVPEANIFTFRACSTLGANTPIGGTSFTLLTITDLRAFPASGFVKFLATGEVVTFTRGTTSMSVAAPGLVQSHTAGELIELCDVSGTILYPEFTSGRGYGQGVFPNSLQSIDP